MINENDTAFPANHGNENWISEPGLTIRQHFAAMAMQGLLSNIKDLDTTDSSIGYRVQIARKYADGLINELNKQHEPNK